MGEKKEVFISYSRRDSKIVRSFAENLRQAGVSVWIDERNIPLATLWPERIVTAIDECKVGILFLSNSSVSSNNVSNEVNLLFESKKKIIPIYLEKLQLTKNLRYQLTGIQHLDLSIGKSEDVFQLLLDGLRELGVQANVDVDPKISFESNYRNRSKRTLAIIRSPKTFAAIGSIFILIIVFWYIQWPLSVGEPTNHSGLTMGNGTDQGSESEEDRTSRDIPNHDSDKQRPTKNIYAFSVSPILVSDGTDFRPHLMGAVQSAFPGVIPAPLEDAEFSQAFAGNVQSLSDKRFFRAMDALVLGRANVSFQKKSTLDPDLISCNLNFSMQTFAKSGETTGINSFRVVGVGFSNEDAARNAMEKLMDAYGDSIFPAKE